MVVAGKESQPQRKPSLKRFAFAAPASRRLFWFSRSLGKQPARRRRYNGVFPRRVLAGLRRMRLQGGQGFGGFEFFGGGLGHVYAEEAIREDGRATRRVYFRR